MSMIYSQVNSWTISPECLTLADHAKKGAPFFYLVLVSTDMENKAAWKECFSVRGIRLPTGYYFGMTAATGDLSDIHDVLSVRLYELDGPNDVSSTT